MEIPGLEKALSDYSKAIQRVEKISAQIENLREKEQFKKLQDMCRAWGDRCQGRNKALNKVIQVINEWERKERKE